MVGGQLVELASVSAAKSVRVLLSVIVIFPIHSLLKSTLLQSRNVGSWL